MAEVVDLEVKMAVLEVRVSEIVNPLGVKIDKLTDSVNVMNLAFADMKNNFVGKEEFKTTCTDYDKQFEASKVESDKELEKVKDGQKSVIRVAVTATVALVVFLFQQLFNIHIKVGEVRYMSDLFNRHGAKKVVLHHLGDGQPAARTVAELQRRANPYNYQFAEYDFGILEDGTIVNLRPLDYVGAHCIASVPKYMYGPNWWNQNSIGVWVDPMLC